MKPYFSAQFDLLNATGRPFNRPLTWDFPEDPMTWKLAEHGIGDPTGPTPDGPPSKPADGAWAILETCNGSAWNQQFVLNGSTISLAAPAANGMCLDNGGASGHSPPDGPYPVHMWGCSEQWAASQTWAYDVATKALSDPDKKVCLAVGADPSHPSIAPCNASNPSQQFVFTPTGGPIVSATGTCLAIVPAAQSTAGVADQYMMGDGYMAAPVLNLGQRSRRVYFPVGASWQHHYTGTVYKGGTTVSVDAPLDTFPLFKRMAP